MAVIPESWLNDIFQEVKSKGLSFIIMGLVLWYFYDISKQDRQVFVEQIQKSEEKVTNLTNALLECYELRLEEGGTPDRGSLRKTLEENK